MSTLVVDVSGMTCDHCVGSVSRAIGALDGVDAVEVALNPTGLSRVTINHHATDLVGPVAQAVASEGYSLEAVAEGQ